MGVRSGQPSAAIATAVSRALRALSLCVPVALAQAAEPAALSADIPAEPLAQALAEFSRQTGQQLVYVSAVVRNQRSQAVAAGTGVDTALAQLLQHTGLTFEHLTPNSVRIVVATPSANSRAPGAAGEEAPVVIVTASRREESLQDVPVTVQALNGEQLRQIGVTTFNALLHYTPGVTYSGNGPATGNIYIRGLGSAGSGNQSQETIAPFPNVALYLDEQSMQFPGRNNDVYMVDLERVEILEGPQGTLFGGGAQAGAIRYITNKPKFDVTSGEAIAGYGTTAGGANNSKLSAVLNVPLVADKLAARAVIFSERQGGYVDNVPGTISYLPGTLEASTGVSANNAGLIGSNTNPVSYQGVRLALLWNVSDAWTLLLQQNYQNLEADGYFYAYPNDSNGKALQPYQITAFAPAYTKDRYESTAWTLNGEIGPVSAVYTGSFMIRHIEGQQDYSNYLRNAPGHYYGCIGAGAGYFNETNFSQPPPQGLKGTKLTCYPPVAHWHDAVENQHQTHELRINTDPHQRLRGIVGAYWEKFVIFDQMDFDYLVIPQCSAANLAAAEAGGAPCLSAVGPVPGAFANDPRTRQHTNTAFGSDAQRGYKQLAFFGSVDFDLIERVLTLSAGIRHYTYDEFEYGSEFYTATTTSVILNHPNGSCTQQGACGFPINLSQRESGFVSRATLAWHVTPDVMAYYTYSEGFRPAGFNRVPSEPGQPLGQFGRAPYCGTASTDPRCQPGGSPLYQYVSPASWNSDDLINNELGIKSEFLEHRVLLNASLYRMNWNHVQQTSADVNLGNNGFVANGPSYTVRGVELQLTARVTEGLTLQGSGSWNHSEQTDTPCLRSVGITQATQGNPTPAGECITVIRGLPYTNPWGDLGSPLPFSPSSQFNIRARYEWNAGLFRPFAMIGASHIASMHNAPENYPDGEQPAQNPPTATTLKYTIPGYTTYDGSLGVSKDNWTAQLIGSNLTNVYGPTNITSAPFIRAEIPLRPRVLLAEFTCGF
jgi:outer membrane receptor protein involved in Fe transport